MKKFAAFFTTLAIATLALPFNHAFAQHDDEFLVIEAEDGWSIIWDGNDGDHFDPVSPDDGGALVPDNLALAANGAIPFGTSELDPARWDFHVIPSLNDGFYGNGNSWIGADDDQDKYVGIDLGGQFRIGRIAWGRDNGNGAFDDSEAGTDACDGQCDDRWGGGDPYTLQITTVSNPNAETPESDWETIGTFEYLEMEDIEPGEGFTPWLRHEYEIARTTGEPTIATGVRIIVPSSGLGGGTAIDEIEVYGPVGDPRFFFTDVNQISDRPNAQTLNIPIANRGSTLPLNITSATLTGDPAFALTSFPSTLDPLAQGEIVVEFDPQGNVGRYLAEIVVESNDEFFPEATVPIMIQVEHANGLIAHYQMDESEGDQLIDSSGNNHHGTYVTTGTGAVTLGEDPLASGGAARFGGELAYAEVPPEAGLPVLQTFSVSMWVNFDPAGAGNFSSLVSKGSQLGNPFSAIANVGGPLQFFSAGLELAPTETSIDAGQTHHVAVTHEDPNGAKELGGSIVRMYLDGELVFENLETDGFDDRTPSPLQIGATAGEFGMLGTVDDVQLYKVPFTADQVVFLKDNPGEVLPANALGIRAADGFAISWDGNDGDHFDATAPPEGALAPDNLALPANGGAAFSSSDLGPELGIESHLVTNLNDGFYGNSNSWISASDDPMPFAGINLGSSVNITAVAWGRDNGNGAIDDSNAGTDACDGQCDDRAEGLYTLQITSVSNPSAATPEDAWTTVGTFDYRESRDTDLGGAFTSFLRHEFALSQANGGPILATGVRLLVPAAGLNGGTAIDELEVYGQGTGPGIESAEGFSLGWDGNEGEFFNAGAPPAGSIVPDNAALAANGAIAFTTSDLGPELGIDFHIVDNVNDGFYGNANSWISASDDVEPFLGVNLGGPIEITSVAWGRDNGNNENDCCGGQLSDRSAGVYTLQVTMAENPNVDTPDAEWMTVGSVDYDNVVGNFQAHLRHEYQVSLADGSPIVATGVRLLVPPTGTAVDEFEVNPIRGPEPVITASPDFSVTWDRTDGAFFDAAPPPNGALAPNNLALASNGATAFASGELGPELELDFHVAANLNDGFYGNANSWIGAGDAPYFAGIALGGQFDITAVAWSRDNGNGAFDNSDPGTDACGGQCGDRWAGVYELQVTDDENPGGDSSWTTIATIEYVESADIQPGGGFTGYLRHEYAVSRADGSPVSATGIRILTPDGGTAIDEIEIYGEEPPAPTGVAIATAADFSVIWDGNDGDLFDATPPPDGSLVPDNLALASNGGTAFASGELGPQIGVEFHVAGNLNDGFYGNGNAWIGAGEAPFFAGINLGGTFNITSVAWGRDNGNGASDDSDPGSDACGGQCDDRWAGTYELQITNAENPDASTSEWTTVATFDYQENNDTEIGGGFTGYLRHAYDLATSAGGAVSATGIRLLVPNADIAIDEIEVFGFDGSAAPQIAVEPGFAVAWDGNDGVHFDMTAPPEGAVVPSNLALASQGGTAFSSGNLGPELGIGFHVAANLNDGIYGNSNSWISASGDDPPFAGVNLGGAFDVSGIAWGRDNGNGAIDDSDPGTDACGGQCDDRALGVYTLQITTVENPNAATPADDWTTVATFDYTESLDNEIGGAFTAFLRHEYQIMRSDGGPVTATGVRLLVPAAGLGGGTAIDELEVYQAMPGAILPSIARTDDEVTLSWIGEPGARYFVEFSPTMEADQWQILPGADTVDGVADGPTSVMDMTAAEARKRFYRIGTR